MVSSAERDGKRVIAVTLRDPNDWADHTALLNYGLEKIKTTVISPEQTEFSVPVISAETESIKIEIEDYSVNSLDSQGFSCQVNLPKFIYAPLKKGEKIGNVVYYKNGKEIYSKEILCNDNIQKISITESFGEKFKECFKSIFKNIWVN